MRAFVGVEVDDEVRDLAHETISQLQRRLRSRLDIRWVPLENMHLTVRFIGHVPDDRVDALLTAIAAPLAIPSFDVELHGCGRFPARGAPRVLWIGLVRGQRALADLHEAFNDRLRPFGYEPEHRPFGAHLTLARIKDAKGSDASAVERAVGEVMTRRVVHRVERVTVFESRLSPKGPHYTPLRHIELPTP